MIYSANNEDLMEYSEFVDTFDFGVTREIETLFKYDFNSSETFADYSPIESHENRTNSSQADLESQQRLYQYLKRVAEEFSTNDASGESPNRHFENERLINIESTYQCLPCVRSSTQTSLPSPIALSPSVAISNDCCSQLQLVHPLEDTYRPRYKSDYFPQNSSSRRPRYIADNVGHHFLELKIPQDYRDCSNETFIRIALITVCIEDRGHYYSAYKFQKDHDNLEVPDENPIYLPISSNSKNQSRMKLFLVLIKSKLDQLNDVQPLRPFSDSSLSKQKIIPEEKLGPKELITKYQLNKSQIAFTICTKINGDEYKVHPETTLISSILTESGTSKKNNDDPWTSTAETTKTILCPWCSHSLRFAVPDEENQRLSNRKATSNRRKNSSKKKNSTRQ